MKRHFVAGLLISIGIMCFPRDAMARRSFFFFGRPRFSFFRPSTWFRPVFRERVVQAQAFPVIPNFASPAVPVHNEGQQPGQVAADRERPVDAQPTRGPRTPSEFPPIPPISRKDVEAVKPLYELKSDELGGFGMYPSESWGMELYSDKLVPYCFNDKESARRHVDNLIKNHISRENWRVADSSFDGKRYRFDIQFERDDETKSMSYYLYDCSFATWFQRRGYASDGSASATRLIAQMGRQTTAADFKDTLERFFSQSEGPMHGSALVQSSLRDAGPTYELRIIYKSVVFKKRAFLKDYQSLPENEVSVYQETYAFDKATGRVFQRPTFQIARYPGL